MAKAPTARGFTIAEKRALLFEQVSLYAVFLVALIAAAISFVALRAVGGDAGLGRASFLLPIAIDGFGIACSVGIVRSVAQGEGFRERVSEWVGLFGALALSILGNVQHAIAVGAASLPDYVKIAYAVAIPLIVAYGIHVYGRAMSKGISAHVLADDPDQLRFDVQQLGEQTLAGTRAPVKAPRAPQPARTPETSAQPARAETVPTAQPSAQTPAPAAQTRPAAPRTDEQSAARMLFDQKVRETPAMIDNTNLRRGLAKTIHAELQLTCSESQARRWVQAWWEEIDAGTGGADPIDAQVTDDDQQVRRLSA